jgi:hypothetical protein
MSGIYLLGYFGIWLFAGWAIFRILRYGWPSNLPPKILKITFGVILFAIWLGWPFWEVAGKRMY